ncbi:hypothetical protein AQS92_09220 [Campylobacter jejuni]|nr:hypothetical protein [Campylobacter jejuni]
MQPKSIILFFYGYILFFRRQMKSRGLEEIKKQLKEQIAKQLMAEKATTKALDKNKGINKEISTKKDIGISL